MKDWERIRDARPDVTDYVIHWTRPRYEEGKLIKPFTTLIEIVECGYLKPSFATRSSIYDRSRRPTVKGPYPAVSFTEQSLENFIKSCQILSSHYHPYGVALDKRALYQYGGRPVIYGSEDILGILLRPDEPGYEEGKEIYRGGLPKEYQYLWMRYEPIPNQDGYVVDWIHEREWRCQVRVYHDSKFSNTPTEGIPLLLPAVYNSERALSVHYLPKILVSTKDEREMVEVIIKELSALWLEQCQNDYLKGYLGLLLRTSVLALNELADDPEAAKLDWIIP